MMTRTETEAASVSQDLRQPENDRVRAAPGWLCGLLVALALLPSGVEAQPAPSFDEVGRFYLQNFAPEDYGAYAQNWAVVQDEAGLIYVGNGDGVLEYDGVSWRLILIPNRSIGRSLATDSEGRIFVGAVGELGYLAPDASGQLRYVSLVEHIPEEDRDFADVWHTHARPEGVYFHTHGRLFRWQDGQMKVWRPQTRFNFSSQVVHDTLYLSTQKEGLLFMARDDTLRQAPGGATFVGKRILALVPHEADAYLAVTGKYGLFRCLSNAPAREACAPFKPGLTDFLTRLQPYHASVLPDQSVAIATLRGGVVLLDRNGHLLRILNEASGLRNEMVWYTYVDRQGGLWLALNNGLARVEVTARLSYFDKALGLAASINDVERHRGRLYTATSSGLFVLEPAAEAPPEGDDGGVPPKGDNGGAGVSRFVPVPGPAWMYFSLLSTRQGLLVGCERGVYSLDQRRLIWQSPESVYSLYRSRRDPTQLYLGLGNGLARLALRDGAWHDGGLVDGVQGRVRSIIEDAQGRLWLGTQSDGVLRLEAASSDDPVAHDPVITRYGMADGLPTGWIFLRALADRVAILSKVEGRLFRMDSVNGSIGFVPDTALNDYLPQEPQFVKTDLVEDELGRVWIVAGAASGVAHPRGDGSYSWAPTSLRRMAASRVTVMYADAGGASEDAPGGRVWVGGPQGLVRLDTAVALDPSTDYSVRIRRVATSDGTRLFDGQITRSDEAPSWPYPNNALRFAFAAPRFDAPELTHYRTRLDGFDDDWSAWSTETDKDYTNLWEGRYVFRVEARDVYGFVSREDTFAFRILPPWHRTWWAYSLYGLALAAAVLSYVRTQQKKLRRERQISQRLREVDQLKDEFLANTSHELRTPLYGITGLAESLIDGAAGDVSEPVRQNLSLIMASGRRLGHLVGDILDFSKLRHKSLELDRGPVELRALVDVVLTLSDPLAGSKKLKLDNAVPPDLPPADADENRLEQILYNLVGNAVKFTEEGAVEVSATVEGSTVEDQRMVIRVTDTGIGIAQEKQERIFDAFEQADASIERTYSGTGLGLAVTRQLVELHGGSIRLESSPGEGSTFSFTLPVTDGQSADGPPEVSAPIAVPASDPPERLAPDLEPVDPQPALPDSTNVLRILAVDDEPVNRQVMQNYLAREPFELVTAASGDAALELIRERRFDLVLLDVMMPRVSGFEVCRVLRETHPMEELPVLFLTAKNRTTDVVKGLSLGANDYLAKPIAKDELLARIRPHLDLLEIHHHLEDLVEEKVSHINILEGILPICCKCKQIRDEEDRWTQMEVYIDQHSEAQFSHGLCPECMDEYLAEIKRSPLTPTQD